MNAKVEWLNDRGQLGVVEWLDNGHVGFGYSEGTPVWQPGLSEEEKQSYFPWGQKSDATMNLQLAINSFLATKGCGGVGTDGKLGPGTCAGAKLAVSLGGPEGVVGPPPTCKSFGTPPACGAPKPPPFIEPECSPTKPCLAGQKCEGGKCVPVPGGGGGSSGGGGGSSSSPWGIILLAGAALGAIYLAMSGVGTKADNPNCPGCY